MVVPLAEIIDGKQILKIIKYVKAEAEISAGPASIQVKAAKINSTELIPFYLQRN